MKKILIILIFSILATTVNAATLNQLENGENAVTFGYGYDYAIGTTSLGYARGLSFFNHRFMPYIDLSVPMFKPDLLDYRVKGGVQTSFFNYKGFDISTIVTPLLVRKTKNEIHTAFSIGTELGLLIGFVSKSWFAGTEFLYDKSWATRIEHSDKYKGYYSEAPNGWYKHTAANIRIGLRGGYTIQKTIEITTSFGISQTGQLKEYLMIPSYYLVFGVNYRFGTTVQSKSTRINPQDTIKKS